MRSIMLVSFAFQFAFLTAEASAQIKAEVVSTTKVWEQQQTIVSTALVRFQGDLYCACREGTRPFSKDGTIRLLTSKDGQKWESVVVFNSPTPDRGLSYPKLTVTPQKELMLGAMGAVKVKTYHNRHLMLWTSKNGRNWIGPKKVGGSDFIASSLCEHNGQIYTYSRGSICGSAQTFLIESSRRDQIFKETYKETVSGFFPGNASLVFQDKAGYCLMNRGKSVMVGFAKAPYNEWTWKPLNESIRVNNAIRLPNGQIVVSGELKDEHVRTSLCWFDVKKNQLLEILELPTEGQAVVTGLEVFAGHLFVSHHAAKDGKTGVYLTKVKIKKTQ